MRRTFWISSRPRVCSSTEISPATPRRRALAPALAPLLAPTAVRRGQSLSTRGKAAESAGGGELPQGCDGAQDRRPLTTPVNGRHEAGDRIRTDDVQLGKQPYGSLSLCQNSHLRLGDTLGDQLGASRSPVGPTRSLARSQRQIGQEKNGCPASTLTRSSWGPSIPRILRARQFSANGMTDVVGGVSGVYSQWPSLRLLCGYRRLTRNSRPERTLCGQSPESPGSRSRKDETAASPAATGGYKRKSQKGPFSHPAPPPRLLLPKKEACKPTWRRV